ncbi:thiol-disulfide oxidoreductase [Pirellula sp. SH-Sr6A]|uniref:peroxiredoxin family protein n=1 Tax=Pirellula sp. SH-Sr6A TaxID=1632865 RepID=UPI00078BC37A|nr:peroxiredoxin family protein [Pirellula sp. SH-Sr6A]AMV34538.1 thiol-disulfide oxidoreductase [Pirellula sp. SH-Sr6A]
MSKVQRSNSNSSTLGSVSAVLMGAASVLFTGSGTVVAQESGAKAAVQPGAEAIPKVGEKATDYQWTELSGQELSLAELQKKGPVVIALLRGYPGYQCPACTKQVGDLVSHSKEFESRGASVVLVYPGAVKDLKSKGKEFLGKTELPGHFHFVLDQDYGFTSRYGLRWEAEAETSYPSTLVIGKDGKVLYSKISRTHGGRAEAKEVLAAIPQ